MNEKEKIKKIYSKHDIKVDEASLKNIMKDENRVKAFTKIYKQEKNRKYELYIRETI